MNQGKHEKLDCSLPLNKDFMRRFLKPASMAEFFQDSRKKQMSDDGVKIQ